MAGFAAPDPFDLLNRFTRSLLDENLDFFASYSLPLYMGLAAIVLCWFFVRAALSEGGASMDSFVRVLFFLSLGLSLVVFYNTPLPGTRYSFRGLIIAQSDFVANRIGRQTLVRLLAASRDVMLRLPISANPLDVQATLTHLLALSSIVVVVASAYLAVAIGPIGQALAILLGPLFVPFIIAPRLDFLFWNWLKFLLQYSMMQTVAYAVVYIAGGAFIEFLKWMPPFGGTIQTIYILGAFMLWCFIAWRLIHLVPRLTNELFSGSSGSSLGILEDAFRATTAAMGAGGQVAYRMAVLGGGAA